MKKKINVKFELVGAMMLLALIKELLFIALMYSSNADVPKGFAENVFATLVQIFIIILIFAPGLFFKNKGREIYSIIVLTIFSLLLLVDLWCYRGTWDLYCLKYLFFDGLFNKFNRSLINPCAIDVLFVIDLPILYYILWGKRRNAYKSMYSNERIREKGRLFRGIKAISTIAICIIFFGVSQYLIKVKDMSKVNTLYLLPTGLHIQQLKL